MSYCSTHTFTAICCVNRKLSNNRQLLIYYALKCGTQRTTFCIETYSQKSKKLSKIKCKRVEIREKWRISRNCTELRVFHFMENGQFHKKMSRPCSRGLSWFQQIVYRTISDTLSSLYVRITVYCSDWIQLTYVYVFCCVFKSSVWLTNEDRQKLQLVARCSL